ncbi:LCP family protein [Phytoactinopolyspora halotolerans]|uniref:LCP family protein n=1 Tax=Phytoactinopolyspora halotolerans TaxID=1981512 RepID=A0A6L9S9F5_9ACTN|nr:LCP family protein [Phytoactinopolyspora halotolerans]NEE01717.1 LCP family protein [Phytoactinopolyspora halotolerans]
MATHGHQHGPRGARRHARRSRRRQRYGRFLVRTAAGTLLPGLGLMAAGRRRIGGLLLGTTLLGAFTVVLLVILIPNRRLLAYGGDRSALLLVGVGLISVAAIWLMIALVSHRLLEPVGLPVRKRLGGVLTVTVAASLVVGPLTLAAHNVFTQRSLIGAISGGESLTAPEIADHNDPWADLSRLNLLLLGSDAGDGRTGDRPDTLIVASVDTDSGDTVMISVPRNLVGFEFPAGSPLHERYPDGFTGPGDPRDWMINAVYDFVPRDHADVFDGIDNPGADATKAAVEGALDIDLDYFVMVNLEGFQVLVDAIGGVTLDVPRDIPIGNKNKEDGTGCTEPRGYIKAGENQHLDGSQALWFARSRCGSDDNDRMVRQQYVLNAIAHQVDPQTMLTQYQSIATATRDIVETDIPEQLFPALIQLMFDVQDGAIETMPLTYDFFQTTMGSTSADPDYDILHEAVADAIGPKHRPSSGMSGASPRPTPS